MSPRRSAAEAAATRTRLLDTAADLASTDGLRAMSRLADACALSKSAITRHFATKTELQLSTLEHALARFGDLVWRRSPSIPEACRGCGRCAWRGLSTSPVTPSLGAAC